MHGIIPLWKPKGLTSHDCVDKIRQLLKTKKVGHTGTLDPNVTGVLPICVGEATKIARYIQDAGKTYEATITLGFSTTTEDQDGDIVAVKKVDRIISREEILAVLQKHTGEITQVPPMYSAIKVKGKRLYEYARQGIEVERPSRKVFIYDITLLDDQLQFSGDPLSFTIRVSCSKGTYIRTLAVTIGEMLGFPSHLSKLVRIASGGIRKEQCVTFDEIEKAVQEQKVQKILLPIEDALSELPKYEIHGTLASKVKNGAILPLPHHLQGINSSIAVYYQNQIIAIYQKHPNKKGFIKPERVLSRE